MTKHHDNRQGLISGVLPVYNEADIILELTRRVCTALEIRGIKT